MIEIVMLKKALIRGRRWLLTDETYTIDASDADALIKAGYAKRATPKIETAAAKPAEVAASRSAKK